MFVSLLIGVLVLYRNCGYCLLQPITMYDAYKTKNCFTGPSLSQIEQIESFGFGRIEVPEHTEYESFHHLTIIMIFYAILSTLYSFIHTTIIYLCSGPYKISYSPSIPIFGNDHHLV